ncbi:MULTISPECIES: phytoene/squalene synthase family protein [unclassified Exiguobacterium]|uniref:phytoene/squalene synthase family protein n=1 Tax=unclassified Exiguobacterium TaxID=2644629 RepID=UPI001039BFD1|nr:MULTISPECIES: phytoene/squalene synthase family protein [unclassified Exiguobacterium]TCI43254.1 squalene/phytoene synthase family protein [Exiguobacterium sp. SH5S32]TCI49975.1 squalene/phytoene synthase family protein [Exiguobacterium sp. SH1S4]TCI68376.1 squalene/phytoene synthase family protein [Exiguobacterium sp. SH1S1]
MTRQEAYRQCEEVMKKGSLTFYRAFSLLSKPDRQAVAAVYTFCRTLDDAVDESEYPEESLTAFLAEFDRFLAGNDPDGALWIALRDVWQRYDMDVEPFFELAEGMKWDLHKTRYTTLEETEQYGYYAASTVGLMLLPILVPDANMEARQQLKQGAIDLGIAMQLTNILRDVGEDLNRDRIYVPRTLLAQHAMSETDLFERKVTPQFVEVWETMATRAETLYRSARETHHLYPATSRKPVQAAALLYEGILDAARSNDHDVFTKRAYVSTLQKGKLLARL